MKRLSLISFGFVGAILLACGGSVSLGDAGANLGAVDGGGDGGASAKDCSAPGACGPALGMPAVTCSDGSIGGNTGRCINNADGTCGWEIRDCPGGTCFDPSGQLDPSLKKCQKASDCIAVTYTQNCCGTEHVAGVAFTEAAKVVRCAADREKTFPACGCATGPTTADDGSSSTDGGAAAAFCSPSGLCESSFNTTPCGSTVCSAAQTCCLGPPFGQGQCIDGVASPCPISRREHKKDIAYLSEADKQRLRDELLGFRLATYRYKTESAEDREHLGFIIDDVVPSPAVAPNGERVDMYGYTTMSVAALQTQAREIAELRKEVEELRRELAAQRRTKARR